MVTKTKIECTIFWKIEDRVIEEGLLNLIFASVKIIEVVYDDKNFVDGILTKLRIPFQKEL